eukprot:2960953-Alexandrium_andersonii.AAC.1
MRTARSAQTQLLAATPPDDPQLAQLIHDRTVEQAGPDKRWLKGPLSPESLEAQVGPCWTGARRFA